VLTSVETRPDRVTTFNRSEEQCGTRAAQHAAQQALGVTLVVFFSCSVRNILFDASDIHADYFTER